jgi:uncharacterized protein (UPF0305 family)
MKLLKLAVVVAIMFLLNGCGEETENLSKAASQIAAYCGSKEVLVSTSSVSHIGDETANNFNITISDSKQIEEKKYPIVLVASHSAKLLYDNLSEEQRKKNDAIIVKVVKSNGSEEVAYPISELKKIDGFIKVARESILKIKSKDYQGLYSTYIDKETITLEVYTTELVDKVFKPNESIFTNIKDIEIAGFNFRKENNFNLVEIYAITIVGKNRAQYRITFKNKKSHKIAGLWVEY